MVFLRSPCVRFFLAFATGMGVAMHGRILGYQNAILALGGLVGLYVGLVAWGSWRKSLEAYNVSLGIIALGAFAMAGAVRFLQQRAKLDDPTHILHHADTVEAYQGVVVMHKKHAMHVALTLALHRVRQGEAWEEVTGKVVVWLPHEGKQAYGYGDVVQVEGPLQKIKPPRHPKAFDYQRLAAQQGVYHQGFVAGQGGIVTCGYAPPSRVMAVGYRLRRTLVERLGTYVQDPVIRSAVGALVLGARDGVDPVLTQAFAGAGILHILAVSGLHVGMLYMILLFLLSLFGASRYRKRWLQGVVILSVLWAYALVTALSPSVMRAVMMMSWSTVARLSRRRHNFWHGLALTALAALWYDPCMCLDVGFQLSYLAVVGIQLFYGWCAGLVIFQHRVGRWLWQMVSVAVSVQMTTLPLSLYYFHGFPTYFLLGNVVAVPAASVILGLGLLCCAVGPWPWVGPALGGMLGWVMSGVYQYAAWIAALPCSHMGPCWLGLWEVALGFGLVLGCWACVAHRMWSYLLGAACCAIGLGWGSVQRWHGQRDQQVLTVYALPHNQAISLVRGRRAVVLSDMGGACDRRCQREVQPSLDAMGVQQTVWLRWDRGRHDVGDFMRWQAWQGLRIIVWGDTKIAWLAQGSGLPSYWTTPHALDVLVVDGYQLPTLTPWLAMLHPKVVVLGFALTRAQRMRFKQTLAAQGILCHDLVEEGAFVG